MLGLLGEVDLRQSRLPQPFFKRKPIQSLLLKFRIDILRYIGVFHCLAAKEPGLGCRILVTLTHHDSRLRSWALQRALDDSRGILMVAKSRERCLRREGI
jgi:hypothetical protein